MMKHAWKGYRTYAWGSNELRPVSKKGHSAGIFGSGNSGATIIDAIDTLYLMGLNDEYKEARNWIATSFKFDPVSQYFINPLAGNSRAWWNLYLELSVFMSIMFCSNKGFPRSREKAYVSIWVLIDSWQKCSSCSQISIYFHLYPFITLFSCKKCGYLS